MAHALRERERVEELLERARALEGSDDLAQERRLLAEAKEGCNRMATLDPGSEVAVACFVRMFQALGHLEVRAGNRAAAQLHRRLSISLWRKLAPAGEERARLKPDLAATHEALGRLLLDNGELEGSLEHLREAVALVSEPGVVDSEAQRSQWLGRLHAELSQAALASRDSRGASDHAKEAVRQASLRIKLEPQEPHAFIQKGYALQWHALADMSAGRFLAGLRTWQVALDQSRRAAALTPNGARYWLRLAHEMEAHAEQLRRSAIHVAARELLAEAVEARRRVVALEPDTAAHRWALANVLNLLATADREGGKDADAVRASVEAQVHLRMAIEAGGDVALPGLPAEASLGLGALPERFIPAESDWRSGWQAALPRRSEEERLVSAEGAELRRERDGLSAARAELSERREAELAKRAGEDRKGASRLVLEARRVYRRADDERYAAEVSRLVQDEASHRARADDAERRWMGQLSSWIEDDRPLKERNAWELDGTARPRPRTLPN
jgi:tetratricopeptide (TPR) repeat protein